jgi:DnaJ family protein C protein 19
MLIIFAAILAALAFGVLIRLLMQNARPNMASALITAAVVGLLVSLAILAATGRLHWLAALGAATLPFLRPFLRQMSQWSRSRRPNGPRRGAAGSAPSAGEMSASLAREVLDLGAHPSTDEVITAHRRLMQKLHPDRGGSTYIAQQLNEAKRVLLSNQ